MISYLYWTVWGTEKCMDEPSTFYMRKYYYLKSQGQDPGATMYMEALSGDNADKYYK